MVADVVLLVVGGAHGFLLGCCADTRRTSSASGRTHTSETRGFTHGPRLCAPHGAEVRPRPVS